MLSNDEKEFLHGFGQLDKDMQEAFFTMLLCFANKDYVVTEEIKQNLLKAKSKGDILKALKIA